MSGEVITVPPKPGDLRERQAAYQDWLLRERQRAALAGAVCCKCVFWGGRKEMRMDGDLGECFHTSSLILHPRRQDDDGRTRGATIEPGDRWRQEWCEHYLPLAKYDPRPEGGTP